MSGTMNQISPIVENPVWETSNGPDLWSAILAPVIAVYGSGISAGIS